MGKGWEVYRFASSGFVAVSAEWKLNASKQIMLKLRAALLLVVLIELCIMFYAPLLSSNPIP